MLPQFETPFELKFLNETGVFEGYASVFGVTDSVNDRILPGAFRESLKAFEGEGRLPPLLWQHDPRQPIGVWREMLEDEHGLYVKGELFVADIPRAREAYRLLRENVVTGLSIGYRAKGSHRDDASGARILTQLDLVEISMVTFPANDMARVRRVKSALQSGAVPTQKEFEALLRDAGMSRKQAKGFLSHGYKSLGYKSPSPCDAGEGEDDTAALLQGLAEKIRNLT